MTLQLAAAIPNFAYLETMMVDVPWRREIVRSDRCVLKSGEMLIPDAPGLGIEIDEDACRSHPYTFKPPGHFTKRPPWPNGTREWFEVQ